MISPPSRAPSAHVPGHGHRGHELELVRAEDPRHVRRGRDGRDVCRQGDGPDRLLPLPKLPAGQGVWNIALPVLARTSNNIRTFHLQKEQSLRSCTAFFLTN